MTFCCLFCGSSASSGASSILFSMKAKDIANTLAANTAKRRQSAAAASGSSAKSPPMMVSGMVKGTCSRQRDRRMTEAILL